MFVLEYCLIGVTEEMQGEVLIDHTTAACECKTCVALGLKTFDERQVGAYVAKTPLLDTLSKDLQK